MFDHLDDELFVMTDAMEALAELERGTDRTLVAQRSSKRIEIRTGIRVQPADASQRHRVTIEGLTADISNGGCMVLIPRALLPGDLFWITFDSKHVRIGSLFARCLRCRLVQEDVFETGFRFLQDIDLATLLVDTAIPGVAETASGAL